MPSLPRRVRSLSVLQYLSIDSDHLLLNSLLLALSYNLVVCCLPSKPQSLNRQQQGQFIITIPSLGGSQRDLPISPSAGGAQQAQSVGTTTGLSQTVPLTTSTGINTNTNVSTNTSTITGNPSTGLEAIGSRFGTVSPAVSTIGSSNNGGGTNPQNTPPAPLPSGIGPVNPANLGNTAAPSPSSIQSSLDQAANAGVAQSTAALPNTTRGIQNSTPSIFNSQTTIGNERTLAVPAANPTAAAPSAAATPATAATPTPQPSPLPSGIGPVNLENLSRVPSLNSVIDGLNNLGQQPLTPAEAPNSTQAAPAAPAMVPLARVIDRSPLEVAPGALTPIANVPTPANTAATANTATGNAQTTPQGGGIRVVPTPILLPAGLFGSRTAENSTATADTTTAQAGNTGNGQTTPQGGGIRVVPTPILLPAGLFGSRTAENSTAATDTTTAQAGNTGNGQTTPQGGGIRVVPTPILLPAGLFGSRTAENTPNATEPTLLSGENTNGVIVPPVADNTSPAIPVIVDNTFEGAPANTVPPAPGGGDTQPAPPVIPVVVDNTFEGAPANTVPPAPGGGDTQSNSMPGPMSLPAAATGLSVMVENVSDSASGNSIPQGVALDTTTTAMNINGSGLIPLPSPVQEAAPSQANADANTVTASNQTAGINTSSMQPMTMPVAASSMTTSAGAATAATTSGMSVGAASVVSPVATPMATPVATPQSGYSTPITPVSGCGY